MLTGLTVHPCPAWALTEPVNITPRSTYHRPQPARNRWIQTPPTPWIVKSRISTAETVRKWVRQAEIDQGARPGTTSEESAELKRLKRENAELKRANAILKAASVFFAAELDRPGQ